MKLWKFFCFSKDYQVWPRLHKSFILLKINYVCENIHVPSLFVIDANPKAYCSKDNEGKVQRPKPKHHMIDEYKLNGFKAHAPRVSKVNHKHAFMYTYVWTHKAHNHISYSSLYTHYMCVCVSIYIFICILPCKALLKFLISSKSSMSLLIEEWSQIYF